MSEEQFEIIGEKYIGHMQGNAFVISNTDGFCIFIKENRKEKTKDSWLLQKEIDELFNENRHLKIENKILEENEEEFYELKEKYGQLEKENEQLRQELQGMNELLKSYRKTIKHDAELLADATRNGYLPPLDDIKR